MELESILKHKIFIPILIILSLISYSLIIILFQICQTLRNCRKDKYFFYRVAKNGPLGDTQLV
jgi:hypothetical protein